MARRTEHLQPTLETFQIISNQGVLDLSSATPETMGQLVGAYGLPQEHSFATLHNRLKGITDPHREIFYTRHGVARNIVDEPALLTWKEGFSHPVEGVATTIEELWPVIEDAVMRADIWDRLYGSGFVVQGYNDGRPLASSLGKATDITWAHAFSRRHVADIAYDKDPASNTYGQPVIYKLRTSRPGGVDGTGEIVSVHRDRILPLVERPAVNPLLGESCLNVAWNDLEDIASIVWANAEAYYGNASPKLALKTARPLTPDQDAAFNRNISAVRSGVRSVVKMLSTMELIPLNGQNQIPKPLEHAITSYVSLSLATGMPFSWFYQVHITSGDGMEWAERQKFAFITDRQRTFGKKVARHWLGSLAKAGMVDARAARRPVIWNTPRTETREDIAKNARNEAIALATSVAKTGLIPAQLKDRFVNAPPEVIQFMERLITLGKAQPGEKDDKGGTTGEKSIQPESQSAASTKNLSRGS